MSNSQRPVTVILPRILKSLIACAAAALIGPTLYLSGFLFVELITGVPFWGDILQIGSLLVIPCCLVLTVLIVFWMPTQALMQRLHQTGFVMLACGGFLFGLGHRWLSTTFSRRKSSKVSGLSFGPWITYPGAFAFMV